MWRMIVALNVAVTLLPAAAWGQTSPSPFTTGTRYDAAGRVTGTISPDPDGSGPLLHIAVRNTYDAAGQLVRVEKGELSSWQSESVAPASWGVSFARGPLFTVHQATEMTYDVMGRKTKEAVLGWDAGVGTFITFQVAQHSYDLFGRLECTAVRMNPAAFSSLPTSACALGTQGSQGPDRITKNVYDAAGQLLQVRKAVGTPLEQAYATYSYTLNGKQEYVVDANGNKARLVYDGHDRQVQWQFPSAGAPPAGFNPSTPANALATAGAVNTNDREEYGYDANGNRTSLRKRDGRTFTYSYDALNRVTSKIVPDACVTGYACTNVAWNATRDVYYSYDLRGLQTAARFDSAGGSDAVTSVYDGLGRIRSSTTSMGGVSHTLSYEYDADGNRTRVTHPDGNYINYHRDGLGRIYYTDVNGALPLFYPPYDAAGRMSMLYRWVGGTWNNYSAFGYDGNSRRTSIANAFTSGGYNVTSTFAYNPANQIVSRTRSNDAYAFNGYVSTNRGYAVNGLNQYTSAGPAAFGYDANGNLTSDGTTAFTYDAENRLVVTSAGAQLTYDPLGRLYETYKASTSTTRFLYDGDELVAEYDGAGTLLRRYVHGGQDDDPQVWFEGSGVSSPRFLYADHQGSVTTATDAAGNVITVNSYDEYGIPASGNAGRFQYTGQAWMPELGMYHYKARIYSPTLGRFLQTDPIGYHDQVNLYAYVANDPINGRDPTGMEECHSNGDGTQTCTSNGSILDNAALALRAGYELLAYYTGLPSLTPNASPATPPNQGDSGGRAGRGGDGRPLSRGDNGGPSDPKVPVPPPPTEHGQQRRDQAAAGDTHRQVGDPNRVIREGRTFRDTQTGNTIHVNGNRVVVTNAQGQEVTRWTDQTRANTQSRIRNGRWEPQ